MDRTQQSRRIDQPEPCFVRLRMIANGPNVGARIFLRLGMLAGEIQGRTADPHQIWHAGELIDEAAYLILIEPPLLDPFVPVYVTDRGLAEAVRAAEEADYWWTTRLP